MGDIGKIMLALFAYDLLKLLIDKGMYELERKAALRELRDSEAK
jgi:hypothetical protein